MSVAAAKIGPDYIDPRFHEAASGRPCINLDLWAMGRNQVDSLASMHAANSDLLVAEGVMGLFDGADGGGGSSADVAAALGLPVVLVVDATSQSQSVAAVIHGFRSFRDDINIAGVILNKVGSERHETLLREACKQIDVVVVGAIHRVGAVEVPSRHLGLVQAQERSDLETLINQAADLVEKHCDLGALNKLASPLSEEMELKHLSPLGQRIAVADDLAFAFCYPHLLQGWQRAGAELLPFSPLADEAPASDADAIFLPGGYPELYAGQLAANQAFKSGMQKLARTALIYGECGGFMVLGDALIDANGTAHKMLDLLPVTTSFEKRTRHLGYRTLTHDSPLPWPANLRGHEFHYSTLVNEAKGQALFNATDSRGNRLGAMGLIEGRVMGSYAHVISEAP